MSERFPRQCEEAMAALLDGKCPEHHLGECPSCRGFAARLALVDGALLAGEPQPLTVPEVSGAVLVELMQGEARRLRYRMIGAAAAMTGTASLVIWGLVRLIGPNLPDLQALLSAAKVAESIGQGLGWITDALAPATSLIPATEVAIPAAFNLPFLFALATACLVPFLLRRVAVDS